jgi:hypothetical protein
VHKRSQSLQPKCTLDRFEKNVIYLFVLSSVLAAFSQSATTTGGLAQNGAAAAAKNNGLSVAENSGDCVATVALNVHKVRVRALD